MAGTVFADEVLDYGWDRYRAGAYADAREAALTVLDEDPAADEALRLWVASLAAVGRASEAEPRLVGLVSATAEAVVPKLLLASVCQDRQPQRARGLYRAVLAASPRAFEAAAGLGELAAEEGAYALAATVLGQAFATYRAVPEGELRARDLDALARCARVAERVPALREQHVRSFAQDAKRLYQEAWRLDPGNPDRLVAWAELYLDKWDLNEAQRLVRKALELNKRHARAHALAAAILIEDGYKGPAWLKQVRNSIEQALTICPNLRLAWLLRAHMYLANGELEQAQAILRSVLTAKPTDAEALGMRAAAWVLSGDEARAETAQQKAEKSFAGAQQAVFHGAMARVFDRRFRYQRADVHAREAVASDPGLRSFYGLAAMAATRIGDIDRAREYLVNADPFDLFALNQSKLLTHMAEKFVVFEAAPLFRVRMEREVESWLRPYVEPLLARCWQELSARYDVKLQTPIYVEFFSNMGDFSVRAVAHPFIPAAGVAFWRVVVVAAPGALPAGTAGWARVLWHELAHVAALERSRYAVPRWLTEGLSVLEEGKGHASWTRERDAMLVDAISRGRIMGIEKLNEGFSRPRFAGQVMLAYAQGGMVCKFIEQHHGYDALVAMLDGFAQNLSLADVLKKTLGLKPAAFDKAFGLWLARELKAGGVRAQVRSGRQLAALRRAARRAPKDPRALADYALACADMGLWADAEIAAWKLLEVAPEQGDGLAVLARVAQSRGQRAKALELSAKALALGTRDGFALQLARATLLTAEGEGRDEREALSALRAAHALFPQHEAVVRQGLVLARKLGVSEAVELFEGALLQLAPNDADLLMELAKRTVAAEDLAGARALYEQVLWIAPQRLDVHEALLDIYEKLGESEALIERERGVAKALTKADDDSK